MCVYVLAGNDKGHNEGRGVTKKEGLTKELRAPRAPLLHPVLHISSDSKPTWFYTLQYMWLVILAETMTRTNYTFMEDNQFVVFLFLLYQTWSMARIGPHVYWLKYVCVPSSLLFFRNFTCNYKVASFFVTGLKLLWNHADDFHHSNGVLVMVTLFFHATLWILRFKNLFCVRWFVLLTRYWGNRKS